MRGDFRPLPNKNVQIWDHFFPLLFPQGFRISKNFGHPTSGKGGKKTFKRYLKSEQTDKQTDGRTFQLIESIGPEGRCFENVYYLLCCFPQIDFFIDLFRDLYNSVFILVILFVNLNSQPQNTSYSSCQHIADTPALPYLYQRLWAFTHPPPPLADGIICERSQKSRIWH